MAEFVLLLLITFLGIRGGMAVTDYLFKDKEE